MSPASTTPTSAPVAADASAPAPRPGDGARRPHARRERRRRNLVALVFLLPAIVLFLVFFVGPAGLGLLYSFTDYRGYGTPEVVGVENYTKLFADGDFYASLLRTVVYTIICVPFGYCVTLLISALLVSRETKGTALAQVIFFFPWLVSPIVTGVVFRWLFGENFGLVNYLISSAGLNPVAWATDPNLALVVVILAGSWGGTAFSMLLFMAAIRNIPTSYLEAASLDGAGPITRFLRVTWPLLRPTSFMVILLGTIGAMKEFAMIQALNGGGPGTSNVLIVQYIYKTGFEQSKIGYASAASMVLMVILLVIALVQTRFDRSDLD
ncbi:carbohydrate ABC transporter permease [Brachybacterium sp. DNPG3]